jgi:hypothetical protein
MMFKIFPGSARGARGPGGVDRAPKPGRCLFALRAVGIGVLLSTFTGCMNLPPLPPADLSQPGWETRQGQAVWRPRQGVEEIAGEILVSTRKQDRTLVQFSKNPFPLVNATVTRDSWELSAPALGKRYAHPGKPPSRILWFQLSKILTDQAPSIPWKWTPSGDGGHWRLENPTTGESLEGFFSP